MKTYCRPSLTLLVTAFLCGLTTVFAQDKMELAEAEKRFAEHTRELEAKYGNDKNYMVRSALLANREAHTVELLAVAVGLKAGEPVEFLLCSPNGKDYESLAVCGALPSDVQAGLEFIGMKRGRPINVHEFNFWPKGEKVLIIAEYEETDPETGKVQKKSCPFEELIYDGQSKEPLKLPGFVFVGNKLWKDEVSGEEIFLPDRYGDVISTYNNMWTILDVPALANQNEVYGSRTPNPARILTKGQYLKLTLRPKYTDGTTDVRSLTLKVHSGGNKSPTQAEDLRFDLIGHDGNTQATSSTFQAILIHIGKIIEQKKEPYLTLQIAPDLAVAPLPEFFAMLQTIEKNGLIRLEGGPQAMYYEAFLANPAWLKRDARPSHPLEITFNKEGYGGELQFVVEAYDQENKPVYKSSGFKFADVTELLAKLTEKAYITNATFFLVAGTTQYAQIRDYYLALKKQHPIAYIYIDPVLPKYDPPQETPETPIPAPHKMIAEHEEPVFEPSPEFQIPDLNLPKDPPPLAPEKKPAPKPKKAVAPAPELTVPPQVTETPTATQTTEAKVKSRGSAMLGLLFVIGAAFLWVIAGRIRGNQEP